jgi:predicted kinase
MRVDTPTVYLLAGTPASGTSTYAKALESGGVVRLVISDATTLGEDVNGQLVDHIEAGRDVVLDHGLVSPEERERYKQLVDEHGGQWCLIHFTMDHRDLIRRLERRVSEYSSPNRSSVPGE